jgi:hypothetical protein
MVWSEDERTLWHEFYFSEMMLLKILFTLFFFSFSLFVSYCIQKLWSHPLIISFWCTKLYCHCVCLHVLPLKQFIRLQWNLEFGILTVWSCWTNVILVQNGPHIMWSSDYILLILPRVTSHAKNMSVIYNVDLTAIYTVYIFWLCLM